MKLKSINPYNNQLIEEFEEHSDSQVNSIINDTAAAFKNWKYTSFEERSEYMINAAAILLKNKHIPDSHRRKGSSNFEREHERRSPVKRLPYNQR